MDTNGPSWVDDANFKAWRRIPSICIDSWIDVCLQTKKPSPNFQTSHSSILAQAVYILSSARNQRPPLNKFKYKVQIPKRLERLEVQAEFPFWQCLHEKTVEAKKHRTEDHGIAQRSHISHPYPYPSTAHNLMLQSLHLSTSSTSYAPSYLNSAHLENLHLPWKLDIPSICLGVEPSQKMWNKIGIIIPAKPASWGKCSCHCQCCSYDVASQWMWPQHTAKTSIPHLPLAVPPPPGIRKRAMNEAEKS